MRYLQRGLRRTLSALDAAATRLYGAAANPLHQTGTVAVAMLVTLIVSGLYLVLVYRVGAPSASVARLAADPWLGAWIRGLHRYASDLFIIAATLHMLRMFAQARSWGPRTLAWVSGFLLFGAGMVCAWTGFVMAWDTFGERLAREGGRLLDVVPIFSEPLSRIFAGDGPVPSAFFFVNLFIHIGLPLALGVMLWLHVSRLARPVLLPPRRVLWTIVGALAAAAVFMAPTLGPAADPFRVASSTPTDLLFAWWLPLSEHLRPGAAWLTMGALVGLALLVPRWSRRARVESLAPSVVDPRLCTGCNQCPQDCPWEAITMVEREDGRTTLLASVDADKCVSCGICAASCAPMGIGPPGRTGRDQLAALREHGVAASVRTTSRVVAVCCEQAPRSHRDALAARGAYVHGVSCVGNLHTSVVEWFVREGAAGVIVCGCPSRDCVNREGPKWLAARLFDGREAELQPRVDRRRVRVTTMSPGDLRGTLAAFDAFERELARIEPPKPDHHGDEPLVCDTATAATIREVAS